MTYLHPPVTLRRTINLDQARAAGSLIHGWARRSLHGKASTPRQLEALVRYLPTADQATYSALGGMATLTWAQSALDQHVEQPVKSDTGIQVLGLPYGGPNGGKDNEGQFFSPNTDFMDGVLDSPPVMYVHGTQNGFEPEPVGTVKGRWYDRKGGWFNVELDPLNSRYAQLMEAHATGNLRASSGAVPASYSADASTGHIDTWLVGELSLVDLRDGFRPINAYAITKAAPDVLFEDYYGDPVEDKPMTLIQTLRQHFDAIMLLLAREEVLDDGKCSVVENEMTNLDVGYLRAEEAIKAEEPMDEVVDPEKCLPCEEAARMAAEFKAEMAAPTRCAKCPEAVGWIRSMVKAGRMAATEAFGYLETFVQSDETFEAVKAEVEGRALVPAKAEKVLIFGGAPSTDDSHVDPDHMAKQRRLAGLPAK